MTSKYILKQLDRFQLEAKTEVEEIRESWEKGYTGSKYMLPHNQGHEIAINMVRQLVSADGQVNLPRLKSKIKKYMAAAYQYTRSIDKGIKDIDDPANDVKWDDEYFRQDGLSCACQTILAILRKEVYLDK